MSCVRKGVIVIGVIGVCLIGCVGVSSCIVRNSYDSSELVVGVDDNTSQSEESEEYAHVAYDDSNYKSVMEGYDDTIQGVIKYAVDNAENGISVIHEPEVVVPPETILNLDSGEPMEWSLVSNYDYVNLVNGLVAVDVFEDRYVCYVYSKSAVVVIDYGNVESVDSVVVGEERCVGFYTDLVSINTTQSLPIYYVRGVTVG